MIVAYGNYKILLFWILFEVVFMGVVYRNKREIPIPDGLHINHSDGRVYSLGKDASGNKKRMVFGYATSEKT